MRYAFAFIQPSIVPKSSDMQFAALIEDRHR